MLSQTLWPERESDLLPGQTNRQACHRLVPREPEIRSYPVVYNVTIEYGTVVQRLGFVSDAYGSKKLTPAESVVARLFMSLEKVLHSKMALWLVNLVFFSTSRLRLRAAGNKSAAACYYAATLRSG